MNRKPIFNTTVLNPLFVKLLILSFVVLPSAFFLASCGSKQKKEEAPPAAAIVSTPEVANDSAIVNKEMAFNATGSDSGTIPGLSTVNFELDKASLSPDSRKKLSDNAVWIKGHDKFTVQIEGHCDARGSIEYNLSLGERRAKATKSYLVSLGVGAKQMTVISYGKEKPLVQGDSEDAYSKNRRANFVPIPR